MKRIVSRNTILFFLFTSLLFLSNACEDSEELKNESCSVEATVIDISGLAACQWALELSNGEVLLPMTYLGESFNDQNLATALENGLSDGLAVTINYQIVTVPNACTAGETVDITCIAKLAD